MVVIRVIREFSAVMQHGALLPFSQMSTIEFFLDIVQSGSHRKNLYVQDIPKFYPAILVLVFLQPCSRKMHEQKSFITFV